MQTISNTIYETYLSRLEELTPQKAFHFANRLRSWADDPRATTILQRYSPQPSEIQAILMRLLTLRADENAAINFLDLRAPYFTQYPWLYGLELALFQMRHWYFEYGIDTRSFFRSNADFKLWDTGVERLYADTSACATLSSYAVNTIYLWYRLIQEDERTLFTTDSSAYLHTEKALALYFSTHCCLGETLFYARAIPADKLAAQCLLLSRSEVTARKHSESLPLDALLETVIALKLCGIESSLRATVLARVEAHFDTTLGYITDPAKPDKNDLNGAEHRNVLYLMATMTPRQALLP